MDTDFITWLTHQMDERDWNNTDLARRASVVPSTVSMIVSGQKRPGLAFCKGVAKAFGVSPEYVLRLAGQLPPVSPSPLADIPYLQEIAERVSKRSPERQRRFMAAVLTLLESEETARDVDQTPVLREPTEVESGPG
jgi:transcriptional regulator with XRE-family HTH domain